MSRHTQTPLTSLCEAKKRLSVDLGLIINTQLGDNVYTSDMIMLCDLKCYRFYSMISVVYRFFVSGACNLLGRALDHWQAGRDPAPLFDIDRTCSGSTHQVKMGYVVCDPIGGYV